MNVIRFIDSTTGKCVASMTGIKVELHANLVEIGILIGTLQNGAARLKTLIEEMPALPHGEDEP